MGHHVGVIVLVAAACGGCARVPDLPPFPVPPVVPRLQEPFVGYRQLGLLASAGEVQFVGDLAVLAAAHDDSVHVVLALSMPNVALTFRQHPDYFEAQYQVRMTVGDADSVVSRREAREVVRVAAFEETRREEESLLFQQTITIPRGSWTAVVEVRDEHGNRTDSVVAPLRADHGQGWTLTLVHEVAPRSARAESPRLLANPTHTVRYPVDTLQAYLEVDLSIATSASLQLLEPDGSHVWTESVRLTPGDDLASAVVRIPASLTHIGALRLELLAQRDGEVVASAPVVISVPGLPGIISLSEMRSVLRYFQPTGLDRLEASDPAARTAGWHDLWRETDPAADTPANEALEEYFQRVMAATVRYEEVGRPGWLTDRGMVYLTLGPADRVEPARIAPEGGRVIRWRYRTGGLSSVTVSFEDPDSSGRYRLTDESRRAFERLRISRQSGS